MKPSIRAFQAATSHAFSRSKSTSFIGLGRMGYQMAYNLFSKQYIQDNSAQFVVCDTNPDAANAFSSSFTSKFPGAVISYAETPEQ